MVTSETNRKIAITGAYGFIGSEVASRLIAGGQRVLGIGHKAAGRTIEGIEPMEGDLFQMDLAEVLGWEPDVLVHLAAPASVGPSWLDVEAEVRGSTLLTARIVELWRKRSAMTLLYVSSAGVYGDHPGLPAYAEDTPYQPQSPYGICKSASEQLIRLVAERDGLDYRIVRPFSVYGPGLEKQVVYALTRRFLDKESPLAIQSTGDEERDFVHVRDCAAIIAKLCLSKEANVTLNIGTGRPVTLRALADLLARLTGHEGHHSFTGQDSPGNPKRLVADVTKLASMGYRCGTTLEDGLEELVRHVREHSA